MTRLGITWFWTFLIPLATGLVLGLYLFGPYTLLSSPGDQHIVMRRYDSFFCDGIQISSDIQFNAYMMGHTPQILQDNRTLNRFHYSNTTKEFSYESWNFYLLQGSNIQLQLCNVDNIEFYLIEGSDNFHKWQKHPLDCKGCFVLQKSYSGVKNCSNDTIDFEANGTNFYAYDFAKKMDKTDEYYIVFQNPSTKHTAKMTLELLINRTMYDLSLSNQKSFCNFSTDCKLSLSFLSKEAMVYESLNQNLFNVENTVSCSPTWVVYLALFGGIPFIAGFVISLLLFICYMPETDAWEGVYRPKPWDEGNSSKFHQILEAAQDLDMDPKENKGREREKFDKAQKTGTINRPRKSGYDTLSEEDTDEENQPPPYPGTKSERKVPGGNKPAERSSLVNKRAEDYGAMSAESHAPQTVAGEVTSTDKTNGAIASVEVHAAPN